MSDSPPDQPWLDDDLSAEEVRQLRRRQLHRKLLLLGLPAVAALALAVAVLLPHVKDWRARQFAERARLLLAEDKLPEAFNNASSALQLRPGLPDAQRAYAEVLLAAGQPEALPVLDELVRQTGATEDRFQLAEAALRFGDANRAAQEATLLGDLSEQRARALELLARTRLAQQRPEEAKQLLQESSDAGGPPTAALLLARLHFAADTPEGRRLAVQLLEPLAARRDETGLEALLILLLSPALDGADGTRWIHALRAHPLATDDQKLAAAEAEIRLNPDGYDTIVRRTIDTYRQGTVEQRAQLARWLNGLREHATVLEIITPEEAAARGDLFLIRLDALAGSNDWPALRQILEAPNLPLSNAITLLFRGRAARETGQPESAATHYRRAIIEAVRTPDELWYIVDYLKQLGEDRVLETELQRLTQNPAVARRAYQALVPLVQKRRDADELYRVYDRMRRQLPADPVVLNDYRYFEALSGRRPDVAGARDLVEREPQMLAYRITLALTLLKSGQHAAALGVFDGVTLDPAQVQPYQRAVLASVLGLNNRHDEARQLAESVPRQVVTEQEFALIAPWQDAD